MSMNQRNEDQALRQASAAVPPMPQGLHDRWVEQVRRTPQEEARPRKGIRRGIAVAAAAVLVTGGVYLSRHELSRPDTAVQSQTILLSEALEEELAEITYEAAEEAAEADAAMVLMESKDFASGANAALPTSTAMPTAFCSALERLERACVEAGGAVTGRTDGLILRLPEDSAEALLTLAEELGLSAEPAEAPACWRFRQP